MLSKIMVGLVAGTLTMGCKNSRETDQMAQPRAVESGDDIVPPTTPGAATGSADLPPQPMPPR